MNKPKDANPCLRCGNTKLEWDGWQGSCNVYCPKCGKSGPVGVTKDEAIKKWNESK